MTPRDQEEHAAKYYEYADLPGDTPQERRAKMAVAQAIEKDYNMGPYPSVFLDYPFVDGYALYRPDLLHVMYLGMIQHLMEWIEAFLQFHGRLVDFDAVWRSIPRYTGKCKFNRPYRQITQLQGKDYRYIGKIIYPTIAAALNNPRPSQRKPFRDAIQCTRHLVSCGLSAQYRSHDEITIGNLQTYLRDFHHNEHVFLRFRKTKSTTALAQKQKAEIKDAMDAEFRREDQELLDCGEYLTAQRRGERKSAQQKAMKEAYNKVIADGGDFDFVKIHLLGHFEEAIRAIGNLPSHSLDCSEKCPKVMLKDAMRNCNFVPGFQKQILNYNDRLHSLNLRVLNLQQLLRENRDVCPPEVQHALGLYCRKDRVMVNKLNRQNLPIPEDLPVHFPHESQLSPRHTIKYPATRAFFVSQVPLSDHNFTLAEYLRRLLASFYGRRDIPNEELNRWEGQQFKSVTVATPMYQPFGGQECTFHKVGCTVNQPFHGRPVNDWVWVRRESTVDPEDDLQCYRVAQMVRIYKFRDAEDRRILSALVRYLAPMHGKSSEPISGLLRFTERTFSENSLDLEMVPIESIWSIVYRTGIPRTTHYYANPMIDLQTFNTFYPHNEEEDEEDEEEEEVEEDVEDEEEEEVEEDEAQEEVEEDEEDEEEGEVEEEEEEEAVEEVEEDEGMVDQELGDELEDEPEDSVENSNDSNEDSNISD
ncbi:hypothetical protein BDD12DRAFT_877662 [Trichophaea hybrida]|nr:hypothetical protein BDD12DRAFT_877662 [Trichophaea hybrida]